MAGLGKIVASLFSAANENTLALASLKFDFSLMKVEAPAEYSGLGRELSTKRRHDAEDGTHHQTARRLAALFEQLVPSTPKLITAYGLRSSEIMQSPGINPKTSSRYGPFETFVGADGTAMWAAATSGIPALGMYLLACLLARAWNAKEAISIWVELVDQRRKEIESGCKSNHVVSDCSRMSIRQEILRDDLARWDASARAWLRSADQAKIKEQTQLTLIVKNSQLPFNAGRTTYIKVIEAWQQAMSCLENLMCGRPQTISNRSILLAFSAWHLYPNLVWLGSDIRKVEFNDCCVDPRGVGTIALEPRSTKAGQGPSWSLALSHLRYYGDPVTVKSDLDFSRISIQQLHIVVLGSIFSAWKVHQRDTLLVAHWFVSLWGILKQDAGEGALRGLDWLRYLAEAAKAVLLCSTHSETSGLQLLYYGQRRGKRLLGAPDGVFRPFFGLADELVLAGLSEDVDEERGIACLRAAAQISKWLSSDTFICSDRRPLALCTDVDSRECMTAVPHERRSKKRDADGNILIETVHARWLSVENSPFPIDKFESEKVQSALKCRLQELSDRGEHAIITSNIPFEEPGGYWVWANPPSFYKEECLPPTVSCENAGATSSYYPSHVNEYKSCDCFDYDWKTPSQDTIKFEPILQIGSYRLFLKEKPSYDIEMQHNPLHPNQSLARLSGSSIGANVISAYLQSLIEPTPTQHRDDGDHGTDPPVSVWLKGAIKSRKHVQARAYLGFNYIHEIANIYPLSKKRSKALIALALATQVYLQLDGATISLKCVDTPLNEAPWLAQQMPINCERSIEGTLFCPSVLPAMLERANTLSCIAFFESGNLLLQPEEFDQTLAIASGNSMFVIGALISDPFENTPKNMVKRIVGNIGRTGICLLVSPIDPKIRPLSDQYNLVNHVAYDGKRENNFGSTSLHLSFTDWTLPLEVNSLEARTIDQEAYLVESVISVLDSGKWVADLDVLCIDYEAITKLEMPGECPGHPAGHLDYDYTSINTWEELLDDPKSVGFFRAHGNWAARLAAVSILSQKCQAHSVGILSPKRFCLDCLNAMFDHDGLLEQFESPLPSICID